jgi:hypothetical protein
MKIDSRLEKSDGWTAVVRLGLRSLHGLLAGLVGRNALPEPDKVGGKIT